MKLPNYIVLDLETSVRNVGPGSIGGSMAAPWNPLNKIVMEGTLFNNGGYGGTPHMVSPEPWESGDLEDKLLVGHNIKFDIHYLRRDYKEWEEWLKTGKVWDTQLAEYLLTAQEATWNSLDQVSAKYGGTLKDDKIKQYWKGGADTEDIPVEELKEYLKHDILNTELVFKAQYAKAIELGMIPLIESQMEALLCTAEMEHNGMWFDKPLAGHYIREFEQKYKDLYESCREYMNHVVPEMLEPNPLSNQQLGIVLFGGVFRQEEVRQILDDSGTPIRYKTGTRKGQIKTRKEKIEYTVDGECAPKQEWKQKTGWCVDDGVLKSLLNSVEYNIHLFIGDVLSLRHTAKDMNTYFKGMSDLTWPDGCIHHNLNHCATGTGRLSGSKPNLQNVTSKE